MAQLCESTQLNSQHRFNGKKVLCPSAAMHYVAQPLTAQHSTAEVFMKTIALSELVLDFDIYPRVDVDTTNVSRIQDAITAKVAMPPLVIDKTSKRIIDGFHRYKAYRHIY